MDVIGSGKSSGTYALVYGFLAGPANGRKLRSLLEAQGLRSAHKTEDADILIAHSAGCWMIPSDSKARLVILIGMPFSQTNPKRTFRHANLQNTVTAFKDRRVLNLLSRMRFSLYYGLAQPRRNYAITKRARNPRPNILPDASHVFIANQQDPWVNTPQLDDYLASKPWAFIAMTGSHDDLWKHPDHYSSIINHYARLLAEADG